ncbi:uncharacterized protein LOC134255719 isoform X1 [Saccostrea cucullata]|uniref:uncharacterized protein LOC134255719 isoform X1 n=1 Tax=Saccostrea cuccullata TaxID=36930 RepID=UPI002ED12D31
MTICFVFGCNHQGLQKTCKMFRFPPNQALAKKWERLCRRKDRCVNLNMDRICSCHFKDEKKENGPTQFPLSSGFDFPDPNKISRTVKYEKELDNQVQCVNTDEGSTSDDACVPPLPPHVIDHPYQLSFQRLSEEHKNLKLQVEELTRQIQAMSRKRAFTLEDIIGDERKVGLALNITQG